MPQVPTLLKLDVRLYAAALVLALAVFAGSGQVQYDFQETVPVQTFSAPVHGGTDVIEPRQVPLARSQGGPSYGIRGKSSTKSKSLAFAATDPTRPTMAVLARWQHAFVRVESGGFLQLRTQNPRAPPLPASPT